MHRRAIPLPVVLLAAIWLSVDQPARAQSTARAPQPFRITHYDARIDPRLDSRTLTGTVTLVAEIDRDALAAIALNRGALTIDSVREAGHARAFVLDGPRVRITLPPRAERRRVLTIAYHGAPTSGLLFSPEREQIYTVFSTSQWMPALDEPDARASLRLRVVMPHAWNGVGSGREVSRRSLGADRDEIEWRQDRPVPTYTFGFAIGRYSVLTARASSITLRMLANGFATGDLQPLLSESAAMIAFFEDRAGVPYPGDGYSQVLVARTAGQEMAGLSLLSEDYGRSAIADPSAVGLIAHELAHQWWGNMVTCRAWTEMWLNEGFATFMAAAYREQRFGRDAYLKDIASMRSRYEQVVSRGNDRALVFPAWERASADDRTVVYQKGALVLHELRELFGDAVFWSAVRDYTKTHFGRSVTTADFIATMEQRSGRDLQSFVERWGLVRGDLKVSAYRER